jgi:hypothetical protein
LETSLKILTLRELFPKFFFERLPGGRLQVKRIITKTLAEIYLQQGHLQEAYEIFRALSEKDPSNIEIRKRLNELGQMLSHSSPSIYPSVSSTDQKIHLLKRWLHNIRKRRRE